MARILVVEDDAVLRELVVFQLQHAGYEILQAENGKMGFELARTRVPDLIISDVEMPEMDGRELLAALRNDPATDIIPFIMMTGHGAKTTARAGMGLGADDYLAKPFTMEELSEAVQARLRKHDLVLKFSERKLAELRASLSSTLPEGVLTPLSRIILCGNIIRSDYQGPQYGEIQELAKVILQSAMALHRQIQNFLLYAQLEMLAGSPEAVAALQEGQQTPLKPPLAAVAGAVAQQHGRAADLVLELLEASVAVAEDFLRKMAEELVDNAFKFSAANTPVKMGATVLAGEVVVSVTDEGPGMTSEQVARLETHQQFARKLKARQGIGLGLALAKRLAELHGGALLVQTEVGRGTTMLLRLPAAR